MTSTVIASRGPSPRLKSTNSMVTSQSTPAVTCAPWKPVSVKKVDPNRFVVILSPSCTNEVNSYAWNPRNVVPSSAVVASQIREYFRSPRTTAECASTMDSDDMSRTNVDADVTGMLRIGCRPLQTVCGHGPDTERPL